MYHAPLAVAKERTPITLMPVRSVMPTVCLALAGMFLPARHVAAAVRPLDQPPAMVRTALANELRAAEDATHPMRYLLRKQTPHLASSREICETKEGAVARLLSIDDAPLDPAAEQREIARLEELAGDPGRQLRRKQAEAADTARALKVLRLLPQAFVYQDIGPAEDGGLPIERFRFEPNPNFDPPDLETQVLTAMAGEIWIDRAQMRVARLDGHLQQSVNFGWGILGRLYKGGSIRIDQAEISPGLWRTVRLQMRMSARVLFRTRNFTMLEEESRFTPVPADLGYREAIELLLGKEEARR